MEISNEELDAFVEKTGMFGMGFLQDFITFLDLLYKQGISIDHAYNCIGQQRINMTRVIVEKAKLNKTFALRRCPDCDGKMHMITVNHIPALIVGGGFKTLWYCLDDKGCGYEEYSERTTRSWVTELNA